MLEALFSRPPNLGAPIRPAEDATPGWFLGRPLPYADPARDLDPALVRALLAACEIYGRDSPEADGLRRELRIEPPGKLERRGIRGRGRVLDGLGPRLRAARRAAGLTQEELAEEIGVCANSLARWETGRGGISPHSRATLEAWCPGVTGLDLSGEVG